MTAVKVPHFVTLASRPGTLPRHYWHPGPGLRKLGWRSERVPLDWANYQDEIALEAAAIARCRELNQQARTAREDRILAGVRPPVSVTQRNLGDLISVYRASDNFRAKAPATQRGYRQCLTKLETWGADVPVRAIGSLQVQRLKAGLSATPAFANAVVRVLRLVLEFGRRNGWIQINPALRPDLTNSRPTGLIWPRAAIEPFVAAADQLGLHSVGTAVLLNEWLGQREGDVLRLSRNVLRNGTLWVRQGKTGAGVALPVDLVPHLVRRLEEEAARVAAHQVDEDKARARLGVTAEVLPLTILVCERTRLPWGVHHFRHAFAEVRSEAAKTHPSFEIDHLMPGRDMAHPDAFKVKMTSLTFMRLRHTAVTRLGEAECDDGLISTISGHSRATVSQILERYMVRTSKMARLAFGKRATAEGKGVKVEQKDVG